MAALRKIWERAIQFELTNEGAVKTMQKNIACGRFTIEHYYKMFADRVKKLDKKMELTFIDFPKTLKVIAPFAYQDCHGLTSLTLPDGLTVIRNHAFEHCTGITSLTLPDGVTMIEANAFARCTGLASLHLPKALVYLGKEAFRYCPKLTSLRLPRGLKNVGEGAFAYCTGLTSVAFEGGRDVSTLDPSGKLHIFDECKGLPSKLYKRPVVTKHRANYDWDDDFEDFIRGN